MIRGKAIYASCYGKTYEEAKAKREKAKEAMLVDAFVPKGIGLLILGAGSHGQEVYEIAQSLHIFSRIEFLDDNEDKLNTLGPWEDIYELRNDFSAAIVAVGNEDTRKLWFSKLTEAGYAIPSMVHPSAIISSTATSGVGSVICARAAVSPGAKIGTGCIISAGVAVARDTTVEDWTHIDVGGVINKHDKNEVAF